MECEVLDVPVRSGAIALWLAGPLLTIAVVPHPSILHGDVATTVDETQWWAALHLCAAAGIVLGWWGICCTVAANRAALRTWATPIVASATVGAFVLSGVMLMEAVAFPVLARQAPGSIELDGPLFTSWTFRVVASLGGGYLVALSMLGVGLARFHIWAREGRALAASTVAFTLLAGPFVPVLGPAATVAMAVAGGRVGLLLWRAGASPARQSRPREPVR